MGKKALIFIIIGAILGVALAGGGIYLILSNSPAPSEDGEEGEESKVEEYDTTQGKRLTLSKVQVPLAGLGSKTSYLQADFTIIFKTEAALKKAEAMEPDIKAAIYSVFETKTADDLKVKPAIPDENGNVKEVVSPRIAMQEPLLEAIRAIYVTEEDKEDIVSVVISSFMIV